VGTGIAGRRNEEFQQIIGLFVNTLPLRNYPERNKTFKSFLHEIKEKTLLAYENQECQFEEIVKKTVSHRKSNRNPLCDVAIVLQNVDMVGNTGDTRQLSSPGLILKPYEYTNKISKFDISLICTRVENGLYFMVEYRTKLFKQETIRGFIAYFKEVLAQVRDNSDIKLEDIAISHRFLHAGSTKPVMELNI
jgi:non-ribosomal peptide synthetase component F